MITAAAVTTNSFDKAALSATLMTVTQVCRSIRGARGNATLIASLVNSNAAVPEERELRGHWVHSPADDHVATAGGVAVLAVSQKGD